MLRAVHAGGCFKSGIEPPCLYMYYNLCNMHGAWLYSLIPGLTLFTSPIFPLSLLTLSTSPSSPSCTTRSSSCIFIFPISPLFLLTLFTSPTSPISPLSLLLFSSPPSPPSLSYYFHLLHLPPLSPYSFLSPLFSPLRHITVCHTLADLAKVPEPKVHVICIINNVISFEICWLTAQQIAMYWTKNIALWLVNF